jgi:hypothetical protein
MSARLRHAALTHQPAGAGSTAFAKATKPNKRD